MLTFEGSSGINNVLPNHRKDKGALVLATNVDIGLTGEIARREGYTEASALCHKNLHQSAGYMLATVGGALTAVWPNGDRNVIHPALGFSRVRYCNLPDGRTLFSNGLIHGVTDGLTLQDWTIPVPPGAGVVSPAHGGLFSGGYRMHLTYRRLSDRLEGPALDAGTVTVGLGGVRIDGLPTLDGYEICVYLSGEGGEHGYFAGSTEDGYFEFTGTNDSLVVPCRTMGTSPTPMGTHMGYWRGRVLVAVGNVLWATMPGAMHLVAWRDFRQFSSPITMVAPGDGGIYIGTESELVFLAGDRFDQMVYKSVAVGAVVPGSGVVAPGERVKLGDGVGRGDAVICICGGFIVAGFDGGQVSMLTADRYKTTAQEVAATFRVVNGVPQYLAVPQ